MLFVLLVHAVDFQANFRRWFWWFIRFSQPAERFFSLSFQSLELTAIPSTELCWGKKASGDWRSRMMPTLVSSSRWIGRWCPASMAWLEDKTTSASLRIFFPAAKHGPFLTKRNQTTRTSLGEATVPPLLLSCHRWWGLRPTLDLITLTLGCHDFRIYMILKLLISKGTWSLSSCLWIILAPKQKHPTDLNHRPQATLNFQTRIKNYFW